MSAARAVVFAAAALLTLAGPPAARALDAAGAAKLAELGITLVRVPGGEFSMGSDGGEKIEQPVHQVRVRDFFLATTEVTQAQWLAVMGVNPAHFAGCDTCPVESVSWLDAQEFVKALAARTGASVRLPSEAEWEYAAGGGAAHTLWAGTGEEAAVGDYAWFAANAEGKTHPVGGKQPNAFGLFDMSGNVWEWCQDWHDEKYYAVSPVENPTGPVRAFGRVLRGGSWINSVRGVRTAIRHSVDPQFKSINLNGVRVAADAP